MIKHFAEDLGFEYLSASDKDSFTKVIDRFVSPDKNDKSIILEIFTETQAESDAIRAMWEIDSNAAGVRIQKSKKLEAKIRKIVGRKGIEFVKILLGKK